jgi:hypothetical protein
MPTNTLDRLMENLQKFRPECAPPPPPHERLALHAFYHEVLAAFHRLRMSISQDEENIGKNLERHFKELFK